MLKQLGNSLFDEMASMRAKSDKCFMAAAFVFLCRLKQILRLHNALAREAYVRTMLCFIWT